MKNLTYFFLCGLIWTGGMVSCANPNASPQGGTSAGSSNSKGDQQIEARLFDAVNAYRASKGGKTLSRHSGLDKLAREHSEYLRQNRGKFSIYGTSVSHFGFDRRAVVARHYLKVNSVSENIAAAFKVGSNCTTAVMTLWKQSKDHHFNMLEPWSSSGMGVVMDADGTVFVTQIFATMNNSHLSMRERINQM